jgi:hypothetical protein
MKQTEGLIKSLIFFETVFGQLLIVEPRVPRKARSVAAGFSNPVESLLLERGELLRVETGLIERADPGCRPVFLSAVSALDNVILDLSTCSRNVRT